MTKTDWGPFPKLVDELRVNRFENPAACFNRMASQGNPWSLLLQIGPTSENANQSGSFWPKGISTPSFSDANPILPTSEAKLKPLLIQCHAWMGVDLLHFLAPFFTPQPCWLPIRITETTERALVWTLIAHAIEMYGPLILERPNEGRKYPQFLKRFSFANILDSSFGDSAINDWMAKLYLKTYNFRGILNFLYGDQREDHWLEKLIIGSKAKPGDILMQHRNIERLVIFAAAQLNLPASKARPTRRLGGFRTETFINYYPALTGRWQQAIDLLISFSPLTRLIYGDILTHECRPEDSELLSALVEYTAENNGEQNIENGLHEDDVNYEANETWLTLLARSIVGAISSPSPLLGTMTRSRKEQEQLQDKRKTRGGLTSKEQALLPVLRISGRALPRKIFAHYSNRFSNLTWLNTKGAPNPAKAYLKTMILDMLAHNTVTLALPYMKGDLQAQLKMKSLVRTSALFSEGSNCARQWEHLIFHTEAKTFAHFVDSDHIGLFAENLASFFTPPRVDEIPSHRMRQRFYDKYAKGIALPFLPPHDRGPSPESMISNFMGTILSYFPESTGVEES